MKVSRLIAMLNKQNPDDDVCALVWLKSDYSDVVDVDKFWTELCNEFDNCENVCMQGSEWIMDAIIEKSDGDA